MDGTQTSEPTEAGPGSFPGQASAFRRALDGQAIATEGRLDLTVPLNIAEVRAALATTGPLRKVGLAAYVATSKSASVPSPRPQDERRGHRRKHASALASTRIGRMIAFVAAAVALSVGTACALVLSNNTQNTSVSLPATGTIPMASSPADPQPGQAAGNSGSTSAKATPSLSRSTARHLPVTGATTRRATVTPSPSPSVTATTSSTASSDPSSTAGSSASAGDPTNTAPGSGCCPAPTDSSGGSGNWEVLYEGQNEDSQAQQETTDVQSLLLQIGYLDPWHHRSYIDPNYASSPDANGYYGSSTADAIAQFQQDYGVAYSDQLGSCDATTYQDLIEVAQETD